MFSFRKFVYSIVPEPTISEETLLENEEKDIESKGESESETPFHSRRRVNFHKIDVWKVLNYAHIVLTLALGVAVVKEYTKVQEPSRVNPDLTYSPAQDVVKYVSKTFESGLDYGKSKYQGPPSEKNNAEWAHLILRGLTRITSEEAAPMHNKTMPIPDDPEHYIMTLEVFHQLHCLNAMRYALWNQDMGEELERLHEETNIRHLDHCVDLIRQSLMCNADITPFVWGRDPRDGNLHGMSTVAHTCRDWDAIEQWAAARPIVTDFNVSKPIYHDPLGWANNQHIMDYGEITDWEKQKPEYEAWARAKTHEQHLRGHVGYEDMTNYP